MSPSKNNTPPEVPTEKPPTSSATTPNKILQNKEKTSPETIPVGQKKTASAHLQGKTTYPLPNTAASEEKDSGNTKNISKTEEIKIDPRLLEVLVCPITKTTLIYDHSRNELISKAAGLAFPVQNGIPVMLPDLARPLKDETS